MKLQVGPNIDSTMVRLDFRKSPDKPDYTPSYIIEKTKADEFVQNYKDLAYPPELSQAPLLVQ